MGKLDKSGQGRDTRQILFDEDDYSESGCDYDKVCDRYGISHTPAQFSRKFASNVFSRR